MRFKLFAIVLGALALSACTASVTTHDYPAGYYDSYGYYHRY
jgi:hypothetical protein